MNGSSSSTQTATRCTADSGGIPTTPAKRRHSWSGSRKINVSEENDILSANDQQQHKHNIPINNNHDKVNENLEDRQNFISSLIAGVGSGSLASVVCAPLDLVRTRMQVAGGIQGKSAQSHAKIIKSLQEIYISDGLRGCFRG